MSTDRPTFLASKAMLCFDVSEDRICLAWLELELVTGNPPDAVVPVLSDALLSTAAVSGTAAGR